MLIHFSPLSQQRRRRRKFQLTTQNQRTLTSPRFPWWRIWTRMSWVLRRFDSRKWIWWRLSKRICWCWRNGRDTRQWLELFLILLGALLLFTIEPRSNVSLDNACNRIQPACDDGSRFKRRDLMQSDGTGERTLCFCVVFLVFWVWETSDKRRLMQRWMRE